MSSIPPRLPKLPIGGPYTNRNTMVPGGTTPTAKLKQLNELSRLAYVQVDEWSKKAGSFAQLVQDFHNPSIETRFIDSSFKQLRDPAVFDRVYEFISFALTGKVNREGGEKIVDRGFSLLFLMRDRNGRYLPDLILGYYQQQHDAQRAKAEIANLAGLWYTLKEAEQKRPPSAYEVDTRKGQVTKAFNELSQKAKGMLCGKIWELADKPPVWDFGLHTIREDFSRLIDFRGANPTDLCIAELNNEIDRPFSLSAPEGLRLSIRQEDSSATFEELLKICYLHTLNQLLNDGIPNNGALFAKFERIHPDLKRIIYEIIWMARYKPEEWEFSKHRLGEEMRLLQRIHNANGEGILLQLMSHHENKLALRRQDRELETFQIEGGKLANTPHAVFQKFNTLCPEAKNALAGKIWYRDGGHSNPNFGGLGYGDTIIWKDPLSLFSTRGNYPDSVLKEYRNELQNSFQQADSRLLGDLSGKMTLSNEPYDCDASRLEAEYEITTLRVIFVTAEFSGIAGVGGLAPAVDGMVRGFGVENACVIMPLYRGGPIAQESIRGMQEANNKYKVYGVGVQLRIMKQNLKGVRCYFIDAPELFGMSSIYEDKPYSMKQRRWAVFQKAAAELSYQFSHKQNPFNVVHVHDGQTALVPKYIAAQHPKEYMEAATPAVVYTFHNTLEPMWYNDHDSMQIFRETGLPDKPVNSFIEALSLAEMITTVSRTYAKETQTDNPDFANGLHRPIKQAAADGKLVGIVNGNSNGWNPAEDMQLAKWNLQIPTDTLPLALAEIKMKAQHEICQLLKSRPTDADDYANLDPTRPIIIYLGRYDSSQKGVNKLPMIMDQVLQSGAQFVCVGTVPDEEAKGILAGMKNRARERNNKGVLILVDYKENNNYKYQGEYGSLLRLASSLVIMPSKYEPCGLVQGEFNRFGVHVLATKTGGFPDTLKTDGEGKNGYLFMRTQTWNSAEQDAEIQKTLAVALNEARDRQRILYSNDEARLIEQMTAMQTIMRNAIHSSWTETPDGSPSASGLYRRVYNRALKNRQQRGKVRADLKIVQVQ